MLFSEARGRRPSLWGLGDRVGLLLSPEEAATTCREASQASLLLKVIPDSGRREAGDLGVGEVSEDPDKCGLVSLENTAA